MTGLGKCKFGQGRASWNIRFCRCMKGIHNSHHHKDEGVDGIMVEHIETRLLVYGTRWCGQCRRTRNYLDQHQITYDFIDIDTNFEARTYVESVNRGYRSVPTLVSPDGSLLVEPSELQLINWLDEHLLKLQLN